MRRRTFFGALAGALALGACGATGTTGTTGGTSATSASNANNANSSATVTLGSLQISGVWARATAGMSDGHSGMDMSSTSTAMDGMQSTATATGGMDMASNVGAAYMTIKNTGSTPDKLLKAQGDVAQSIELHTMTTQGGVMKMDPVQSIDVPANGEVALKPGSFHVMMIGLKRDLKVGDKVDLRLTFEKAGEVAVQADVRNQ